jgi:hypothetical protein
MLDQTTTLVICQLGFLLESCPVFRFWLFGSSLFLLDTLVVCFPVIWERSCYSHTPHQLVRFRDALKRLNSGLLNLKLTEVFSEILCLVFRRVKTLAFWYSSISKGKLFVRLYRCVVTTTMLLSVFPISPIYCRPTPAVKLPLFLCPESSIIRVNPRAIRGKTALIHHLEATGVDVDRRLRALRLKHGVVGGISLLRRLQPLERGFFARLDPIIRLYSS